MQVTHNATNAHPIVYHALTVLGVLDVLVDTLWWMEDAPHVVVTAWCVEKGVFVVSAVWDPT